MYHRVLSEKPAKGSRWHYVTVSDFRKQMNLIDRLGYTPITFSDYQHCMEGKLTLPSKPIIITFDDGYLDTFENAIPVLLELNMRAVIFVMGNRKLKSAQWDELDDIDKCPLMSDEQIRMAQKMEFEIGAHSLEHHALTDLSEMEMVYEIVSSKDAIEEVLEKPIQTFSYPYGSVDERVKKVVSDSGFLFACGVHSGSARFSQSMMDIRRLAVNQKTTWLRFLIMLHLPYQYVEWLYSSLKNRMVPDTKLETRSDFRTEIRVPGNIKLDSKNGTGKSENFDMQNSFSSKPLKSNTMRTLYIISKGMDKQSDQVIRHLEIEDKIPRVSLLEHAVSADVLDERYLVETSHFLRRSFYRLIPVSIAQLIEALFIMHRYDVILSHTEKVSFPLALILKWVRSSKPHIVVLSRITSVDSKRSKRKLWFFKKTRNSVTRFLIWSSVQRRIAIERYGVSPDKIVLLKRGIDQLFWSPKKAETDMICSAGMEARDYPTLVDALRDLKIPCHIATGASRGEIFKTIERLYEIRDIPAHVTIGPKNPIALRLLYARSRFLVIPLLPTDSDNGLTTILESMSMGRPVICTRAEGQIDIIQDGVTGIYVPQGDSGAMRDAIQTLWDDPERCEKMGRAAREFIVKHHNMEQFVAGIKHEIDRSVGLEVPRFDISTPSPKSTSPSMNLKIRQMDSEMMENAPAAFNYNKGKQQNPRSI